jgi:hypothetical protein
VEFGNFTHLERLLPGGKFGMIKRSFFLIICLSLIFIYSGFAADDKANVGNTKPAVGNVNINSKDQQAVNKDLKEKSEPVNTPSGPPPKLDFESTKFNFGKQISGVELKHTFTFHNRGKGMLLIDKVKAG